MRGMAFGMTVPKIYLAGPMTGRPGYNYAHFNEVAEKLRVNGFIVLNPAEHFGGSTERRRTEYMREAVRSVLEADWVMLLDGWEESAGARLEALLAMELGLPTIDERGSRVDPGVKTEVRTTWPSAAAKPKEPEPTGSVLLEAEALVHGPRQAAYGHPRTNFERIADLWNARLKEKLSEPITEEEVAVLMILTKVARDQNHPKRDNLVDIAGYAETINLLREG